MKRIVPIIVTDDRVDTLFVDFMGDADPADDSRCVLSDVTVPVPSDDQLARSIKRAAIALEDSIASYRTLAKAQEPESDAMEIYEKQIQADRDALACLRAAFHLDEDDQDA